MHEKTGRYIIDFTDIPAERQRLPELDVAQRINNFAEVELSFSKEVAQQEAKRCLSCRRCLGCALCLAVCKPKAIVFEQQDELLELAVDDIIISPTAEQYMPVKKGEFGYRECANVVSAFEFERILSDSGPTGGMLLRPGDGRIPEKIACIVDARSNGKDISSLLSYVVQEAALAAEKVKDLEIVLCIPEHESIQSAPNKRVSIKKAAVAEVKELEATKNVLITFTENGGRHEEEFNMLFVARPFEPSPEIKELEKKLTK